MLSYAEENFCNELIKLHEELAIASYYSVGVFTTQGSRNYGNPSFTCKDLTYRGSPHLQDKRVISRRRLRRERSVERRVPVMFKVGIGSGLTEERS